MMSIAARQSGTPEATARRDASKPRHNDESAEVLGDPPPQPDAGSHRDPANGPDGRPCKLERSQRPARGGEVEARVCRGLRVTLRDPLVRLLKFADPRRLARDRGVERSCKVAMFRVPFRAAEQLPPHAGEAATPRAMLPNHQW